MNRLTNLTIKNLAQGKKIADGGGLNLAKRRNGGASWTFRFVLFGRNREIGLGSFPALSLQEARKKAEKCRKWVAVGKDPRLELKEKLIVDSIGAEKLSDVFPKAFDAIKHDLKGDGIAGRWCSPVEIHILPKLGNYPVSQITRQLVSATIKPIWHKHPVTARKAVTRLGKVLDWVEATGAKVDEGATDMKKLRVILGNNPPKNISHTTMPYEEIPDFYATIPDTVGGLALKFSILSGGGLRSSPIVSIEQSWIDDEVVTFPAIVIKGPKIPKRPDFRLPLSTEAKRIVVKASSHGGQFLFPGQKGNSITIAALSAILKRRELRFTVHGFRTSYKNWCTDTDQDWAATEYSLTHTVGNAVERSYTTTDFLSKRKEILASWGSFVTSKIE